MGNGRREDDNLVDWRLSALETSQEKLSEALEEIIAQVRTAKYVIGFSVAVLQPIVIGVFIHYMTK